MNIVEAYRKAVKCGGKIKCNSVIYEINSNGYVMTSSSIPCNLQAPGWLLEDNFEVIEPPKPKYSFTEAFKMMEQGKIMLHGLRLYKVEGDYLTSSALKNCHYIVSLITKDMINSNTWEVYDGQS